MIDIVVGGQYGSEGKGKVSFWLAQKSNHKCVIRVGGSNSGHTSKGIVLRHLPCAALIPNGICVIGAGSYINLNILLDEIDRFKPTLYIDEKACMIHSTEPVEYRDRIGSTLSGTGCAVSNRVNRVSTILAKDIMELGPYICKDIYEIIRNGAIIEGTQGFGLSVLHSPFYPYCTSRDTTASGFASEVGISPKDVNDIYLVIRSYPIRVSGNSGPLENETSWEKLGIKEEFTSVTKKVRRIGLFDPTIVVKAIKANNPTNIVLNHLDYIKDKEEFIKNVEEWIGRKINFIGLGADSIESTCSTKDN